MNDSRQRLVVATTELLRSNGFHATSIAEVTAVAGLPSGSLYHHFPAGKVELAEAAIRESGGVYLLLFEAIWAEAGSAPDGITAFFDGAADALEELGFVDICPVGTVAREVATSHDTLRIATDDAMQSWVAALASRLAEAGVASTDVEDLAPTIVAALEGAFLLARARQDADVVRRAGAMMRRLVEEALGRA